MRRAARHRPWAGVSWGKTSRTCPVKVGDFDTDMRLICREGLTEAFLLTLREPITRGAQKKPDLIEGIPLAPAVTGRVLLDAATHLVKGVASELDDMEGVEDAGGVLELIVDGVLVSLEGIQRRDLDTGAKLFAALFEPVLVHGARPAWDQVQQAGRGVILPACQVHDAGELTGAPAASVLVVPYVLVNPQHPHACEAGGVIRCGLQARLDVGPHGVSRGCELSGQASDSGSLETQLSDRPADRQGAQTRPGCAHPLVMFQECHRLAGVFAAYPSPYCATGSAPGPRPRARRSPPPPYARGLVRFSPQPG